MKISKYFVNNIGSFRYAKTSAMCNSKILVVSSLGRIYNFIFARIWHHIHSEEEIKGEQFHCIVCKHPEFHTFRNFLYVEYVIISANIKLLRKLPRGIYHLYHKYYMGIPNEINCKICFTNLLNKARLK